MNILLLAGIAVFLGTISGKVFQRLKIPQVVGYILLGILIGKSFFHVFKGDTVHSLFPLVNFTLGIIGCVIGSELKGDIFRKFGKSIYGILIGEGILSFVAVTLLVTLITKKLYLGLILGAIASATDPASTINVLWEYKAKGPLTRTLTSIVALDDALALIIYGLVSVFSKSMITKQHFSWIEGLAIPVLEISQCLLLGAIGGVVVAKTIKYIKEESLALSFVLGVVACLAGLSMYLHLDLILSSMAFGTTMANIVPKISEKIFGSVKAMTTPLYILFFVVIGAQLDIHIFLNVSIFVIVLAYLFARSFGKVFGAMLGGIITKARKEVTYLTGFCLFTQGGVAMGLALSIYNNLNTLGNDGQQAGLLIVNIVAATTFIVQLIGPPLVKLGIIKADEINRNVTKEDVIESLKVADVMDKGFFPIQEGASLHNVITTIKEKDYFNYPVVDAGGRLHGVITIKELKDALFEEDLKDIILAEDIAVPTKFVLSPQQPLSHAFDLFDKRDLEFLPVVEAGEAKKVVGIVEYRSLNEIIDRKLLERHNGKDKD